MPWTELQYSRGEKSGGLFGAGSRSRFWLWYAGDVVTWPLSLAPSIWIGECAVHRDRGSQPKFLNFVLWDGHLEFPQIVVMHSTICFCFNWNIPLKGLKFSHSSKISRYTSTTTLFPSFTMLSSTTVYESLDYGLWSVSTLIFLP